MDSWRYCVIEATIIHDRRKLALCSHKSWDVFLFLIWWRSLDIVSLVTLIHYRVGALMHETVGGERHCRLNVITTESLCIWLRVIEENLQ